MGGEAFAITAQVDNSSKVDWSLSYDVRIDQHCHLSNIFKLAVTPRKGYAFGMSQPGIVVLKANGNSLEEAELMYYWRIEPSVMNMGGGSDRPVISDVVNVLELKLKGNESDAQNVTVHSTGKSVRLGAIGIYFTKKTWYYLLVVNCCGCCLANSAEVDD